MIFRQVYTLSYNWYNQVQGYFSFWSIYIYINILLFYRVVKDN